MVWEVLASSALQAGAGIYGANAAANAQEDAAKRAGDASSRGTLAQLQLQEPQRFLGYQALADLGAMYGYQQAPYTTINQVQNTLTPLGTKEIKQAIKAGYTPEQIMSLGSLNNVKGKQIKQLTRLGFTPNQLMQMQQGNVAASSAPTTQAAAPATGTGSQPAAGNMSRFFTSPDYQFRMSEGLSAIDRGAAARGGALSGNAIRGGTEYASNLASGEYNNYVQRLLTMAGLGSAATNNATGAVGSNAANQANSQMAAGDARASGILGTTNSVVNGVNNATNLYMLQRMMQPQPALAPPTGYTPAPGMGIMPLRP